LEQRSNNNLVHNINITTWLDWGRTATRSDAGRV
jgi:hypothetical protein